MTAAVTIPAPRYPAKIAAPATRSPASRALPRPLVFTNGVFDVLHRGHVTCLDQARALGAALVVAVNSDASVRRLGKAGDRPLNPLADRMAVLAALAAVDLVVPFDADTPRELIAACLPDVLVEGRRLHGGNDGRRGRSDRRRRTIRGDPVRVRAFDVGADREDSRRIRVDFIALPPEAHAATLPIGHDVFHRLACQYRAGGTRQGRRARHRAVRGVDSRPSVRDRRFLGAMVRAVPVVRAGVRGRRRRVIRTSCSPRSTPRPSPTSPGISASGRFRR